MFFKKKEDQFQQHYPGNYPPHYGSNYEISRLETEINELKRLNHELTKRVTKLENYLGVRTDPYNDPSEYQRDQYYRK